MFSIYKSISIKELSLISRKLGIIIAYYRGIELKSVYTTKHPLRRSGSWIALTNRIKLNKRINHNNTQYALSNSIINQGKKAQFFTLKSKGTVLRWQKGVYPRIPEQTI